MPLYLPLAFSSFTSSEPWGPLSTTEHTRKTITAVVHSWPSPPLSIYRQVTPSPAGSLGLGQRPGWGCYPFCCFSSALCAHAEGSVVGPKGSAGEMVTLKVAHTSSFMSLWTDEVRCFLGKGFWPLDECVFTRLSFSLPHSCLFFICQSLNDFRWKASGLGLWTDLLSTLIWCTLSLSVQLY